MIQPQNFHVAWATPNTIRWAWTPEGKPTDLAYYQLVTAQSQSDLETKTGTAHVWGPSQNQELKSFYINSSALGSQDEVSFTITYGLKPATVYYGELLAHDRDGCVFTSPSVSIPTTSFTHVEHLFSDTAPPWTLPSALQLSTTDPFDGSACLAFTQPTPCAEASANCFEIYRGEGLSDPIDPTLNVNQFAQTAYLEMSVELQNTNDSDWSEVWLVVGDTWGNWKIAPIPAKADVGYRTYQIPLRAFTQNGVALTLADLQSKAIYGYAFGCSLSPGGTIRMDDVSIKW